jgi:hypothetical protein
MQNCVRNIYNVAVEVKALHHISTLIINPTRLTGVCFSVRICVVKYIHTHSHLYIPERYVPICWSIGPDKVALL